jgi:hypothetical protein
MGKLAVKVSNEYYHEDEKTIGGCGIEFTFFLVELIVYNGSKMIPSQHLSEVHFASLY